MCALLDSSQLQCRSECTCCFPCFSSPHLVLIFFLCISCLSMSSLLPTITYLGTLCCSLLIPNPMFLPFFSCYWRWQNRRGAEGGVGQVSLRSIRCGSGCSPPWFVSTFGCACLWTWRRRKGFEAAGKSPPSTLIQTLCRSPDGAIWLPTPLRPRQWPPMWRCSFQHLPIPLVTVPHPGLWGQWWVSQPMLKANPRMQNGCCCP